MDHLIKICGLSTPETLDAALDSGADLVGFVRFSKSPRHVSLEAGKMLSEQARGRAERVVLLVDATDAEIAEAIDAMDPDILQLHGHETPDRVADIRERFGRSILKAIGIAEAGDLDLAAAYAQVADFLLLDAKPPRAGVFLPGGNGLPFDWTLLAGLDRKLPFMLSGGLDPDNVAAAIELTRPNAVDVSSGVEVRPGIKDPQRIEAFVRAARAAFAVPVI